MLPDGIFIGPVLAGQDFIDQRHSLSILPVRIGEDTSFANRDFQRRKVIGADETDIAVRTRIAGAGWPLLYRKGSGTPVTVEWHGRSGGHRGYAGHGGEVAEDGAEEGNLLRVIGILCAR